MASLLKRRGPTPGAGEFDDLAEAPFEDLESLNPRALLHPIVLKAVAGIVLAAGVLVAPEDADRLIAFAVAIGIVLFALASLVVAWQGKRNFLGFLSAFVGLGVGVYLLRSGDRSPEALGRLVGAVAAGIGLRELLEMALHRQVGMWRLARAEALLTVGALLLLFPTQLFKIVTVLFAVGWIMVAFVAIAVSLAREGPRLASFHDTTQLIEQWIADRPKSADDREALYDKILFEGEQRRQRVARFCALISLAAAIGAMGIITDSTAVVIGAMLMAPLLTPLMGAAISLTMGWPSRLAHSALMVVAGMAITIAIAILLGVIAPTTIDTATNAQIVSRATPTLLDLIVALAAGAAGAYGLSRPDVSDALPGVAVAIALLPPLSVVGISYSAGDWQSGNGALLLFSTNAVAILLMGGVTFVLTGVTPLSRVTESQKRTKTWAAALATTVCLILGGLLLNGAEIARNTVERTETEDVITSWLDPHSKHELVDFSTTGESVNVTIVGPTAGGPQAQALADQLREALGHQVTADVRLVIQERSVAVSAD